MIHYTKEYLLQKALAPRPPMSRIIAPFKGRYPTKCYFRSTRMNDIKPTIEYLGACTPEAVDRYRREVAGMLYSKFIFIEFDRSGLVGVEKRLDRFDREKLNYSNSSVVYHPFDYSKYRFTTLRNYFKIDSIPIFNDREPRFIKSWVVKDPAAEGFRSKEHLIQSLSRDFSRRLLELPYKP